jgi:hypothetical protein
MPDDIQTPWGKVRTKELSLGIHTQVITFERAAVSLTEPVELSETNVTLKPANALRNYFLVVNNSNQRLFVLLGTPATVNLWSFWLDPDEDWEMPSRIYHGIISGIWAGAGLGNAMVTEY